MIRIFSINFFDGTIFDILDMVLSTEVRNTPSPNKLINPSDANVIVQSKKDPVLKKILDNSYLNLCDGMPSVWLMKLKGAKKIQRCYGPDLFKEIIIKSRELNIKHFFCGGFPGVAEELKTNVSEKFGNNNIVGTYSPPFKEMSENEFEALGEKISECGTDMLWIGLSSPKQHFFASRLMPYLNVKYIFTVGAAFDFHTERVKQAPGWIQRIGMEWLYRLVREPRRLFKRYFFVIPNFIYFAIIDLLFANNGNN